MNIKKGDKVLIRRGKDRGKTAAVVRVLPKTGRLVVEGVAMVQKHVRPKQGGQKGQLIHVASSIPRGNVMIVCPTCKRGVRVGHKEQDGIRQRICQNCKTVLS